MCQIDEDCDRLYECINTICQHVDVLATDSITVLTNAVFVVFVGFAACGNFGIAAVQVVLLMGALNYSRRESAAISQALLVGMCFGSWIRVRAQKHPFKFQSIVDYKLSCLLLPCLFAGLLGGIQMRNYLPSLALSAFLVLQIVLMMTKTFLKYKSVRSIEILQQVVLEQIQELQQISNEDPVDIFDQPKLLTKKSISVYQEDTFINFDIIFKLISQSKYKDLYLKNLPPDLQEVSFFDMDSKKEIKLKEFILSEYGNEKVYEFQKKHEEELQGDNKLQNKVSDIRVIDSIASQIQDSEIQPIQDSYISKFVDRDTIMSYYKYTPPYEEVFMMFVLSGFNLLNLAVMGGKKFNSLFGVVPCSTTYWVFYCNQFVLNIIFYFIIVAVLKKKSDREYDEACQQYNVSDKNSLPLINNPNKSRVEIPITRKSIPIILLLGLSGGFLMGFIGVGASLVLIFFLSKLRANIQSLMATLPLMIAFSCLLGTLIQVLTGILAWDTALLYGLLCFLGSSLITPIFSQFLTKVKFTSTIIKSAFIFQGALLIIFLFIWIPTISYETLHDRVFLTAIC